jgi:hypothetical protein
MKTAWSKPIQLGVALLMAASLGVAAAPALADHKQKHHWKHGHPHGRQVVYVQPRPVYVPVYYQEPVYVAPPPVYYRPAPVVYERPTINIVVPIFD